MRTRTLFGTRASLSLPAWLLLTPVGVIAAPLAATSSIGNADELAQWLLLGLIAQLPLGAVMLIGEAVSRRVNSRALVVLITLLAGGVRGETIVLLGDSPDSLARVLSSAITMSIWLLAIGAVITSRARYRREVDALLAALVARELHGRLLDERRTDTARAGSAERIAATSDQLRAIVANASDDHQRTASLLQSAIETRLRPLSHDLWFAPVPVPPQAHRLRELYGRILAAQVPVPALSIAALLLLTWGSFVLHESVGGAFVGIAIALTYAVVLTCAQALRSTPALSAWIRYAGSAIIPALVGRMVIGVLKLDHPWSPVAVIIGLPIITVVVAASLTLSADRAATIADLRARLDEPEWDRHLGELVRREVDVDAATRLHNTVQPALTAAALQLQLAALMDDPGRARAALDRATKAIDEVEGRHALTGRDRLDQLSETWGGITNVHVTLPNESLAAGEWSLLADVIDESIANAVRHGRATRIEITIKAEADEVRIEMIDDSRSETSLQGRGLGRTWLDSVLASADESVDARGIHHRVLSLARTELA